MLAPDSAAPSSPRRLAITAASFVVPVALAALILHSQGRLWWCKCGSVVPWSFDIWSSHNSQHLVDPYTGTHVLHGVAFFALMALPGLGFAGWRRVPVVVRAAAAVWLESVWELVENSEYVINKYREATISLDYTGDSIANSLSDIAVCALGFLIASRLPWWGSLLFFIGMEALLIVTIRDSLLINVLMLVYPVEAIKQWQQAAG